MPNVFLELHCFNMFLLDIQEKTCDQHDSEGSGDERRQATCSSLKSPDDDGLDDFGSNSASSSDTA